MPIKEYNSIIKLLKSKSISFIPIPKNIINLFKIQNKTTTTTTTIDLSGIPPQLMSTLLPFQIRGIEYAIEHNGKCLIGDDPGLGKTIQAIAVCLSCNFYFLKHNFNLLNRYVLFIKKIGQF